MARRIFVIACMNQGGSLDRCIREGAARRPIPLDENEVTSLYREQCAKLKRQLATETETFRAKQVEMAQETIFSIRFGTLVLDKDRQVVMDHSTNPPRPVREVDYRALLGAMRHLADLTGTRMPKVLKIDVEHDTADALAHVLASYDPKQREQLQQEQVELERDANEIRALRLVQGGKR